MASFLPNRQNQLSAFPSIFVLLSVGIQACGLIFLSSTDETSMANQHAVYSLTMHYSDWLHYSSQAAPVLYLCLYFHVTEIQVRHWLIQYNLIQPPGCCANQQCLQTSHDCSGMMCAFLQEVKLEGSCP